jgi:hypothetical protein
VTHSRPVTLRAGAAALGLAIALCAAAVLATAKPFFAGTHSWGFTAAAALSALALVACALPSLKAAHAAERFAALGALGGALLGAALVSANFAAGQPQRVPAVPGQVYRPAHSTATTLAFARIDPASIDAPGAAPNVVLASPYGVQTLGAGQTQRSGPYVFTVVQAPLAYVKAATRSGRPVTVTQPDGWAFVSPFLLFPLAAEQPQDAFAVPALHRVVRVAYYAGLPARGINIPFVVLQINEENGGVLYRGVAASGEVLDKAGLRLQLWLGSYPAVFMTGAPAAVPFFVGIVMVASALAGYSAAVVGQERSRGAP